MKTSRSPRVGLVSFACSMLALSLSWSDARGADNGPDKLAKTMLASLEDQSGLCVHLGFRDAELTVRLSDGGKYLVHGLSRDRAAVEQTRKTIRLRGLAGAVSVEQDSLERLPYAKNLVNLIVAENLSKEINGDLLDEILRVLRPGGVAFIGESLTAGRFTLNERRLRDRLAKAAVKKVNTTEEGGRIWFQFRKPRPESMDEWTHRRYDPTRNAVSRDKVDVPSGVRWVSGPNWPTGNRKAAVPGVVASKDRLVYVFDELVKVDDGFKHQNMLLARDAYNGILLWERTTSNDSSPVLVHVGDRVYTVVKDGGPLVALDARSGKVAQTYDLVASPVEVFYLDGRLLARTRSDIRCVNAETGKLLWKHEAVSNMVAGNDRVFLQTSDRAKDGRRVHSFVCLDLASGRELWRSNSEKWPRRPSSLDLILYQDGILVFGGSGSHAISAQDGSHLWSYNYRLIGHGGSYSKVVYSNKLLWVHNAASAGPDGKTSYAWEGLSPKTGKVEKRIAHGGIKHRCMYDVATERYFLCGSMDFVDLQTEQHTRFTAARNSCRTAGVVPANGLVYTFPHGCACYPLLRGFMGLANDQADRAATKETPSARYYKGPAFGTKLAGDLQKNTWSTYRSDSHRSGSTEMPGPAKLKTLWARKLSDVNSASMQAEWDHKDGGRLTTTVVSGGMVFAAVSDTHELSALDADSGEPRWSFVAGGRIDCPPTIYQGLCLFGSRDGWVYCLQASDGKLVWRFRAAPDRRRIVAYGQLESPWPVVGGVLIHDGLAFFAVGRHAGADGGVHVYAAEPTTGKILWHSNPEGYRTLPDLLVASGEEVHMADWQFNAKTGKDQSSTSREYLRSSRLGLLNDAWYKRPLALRKNLQQWSTDQASGQLMTFNKAWVCAFRGVSSVSGSDGRISGNAELIAKPLTGNGRGWSIKLPIGTQIKGMVLAGQTLFIAGRLNGYDEKSNGVRALAIADGKQVAEIQLPSPLVHDCLSVAGKRVYVSTHGGQIICLGDQ